MPVESALSPPSGLRVQSRVVGALLMRELMSRYGRRNIGFTWLMVEPMVLTVGVMIIWSMLRHEAHGLKLIAFVLSGYMPLTLWRHVSSQAVLCLRHNLPLFYHRQVRPLDSLIARSLLEIGGTTVALAIVYGVIRLLGMVEPYADLGLMLAGWFFMAWFAFAAGLVLAALSETYDFVEKLVAPFQYLMLPISGMFFMVAWLPSSAREWALYVPLVHCFEMFRGGMFGEQVQAYFDVDYILSCCIFTTAVGLLLVRRASQHIEFE